MQQDAFSIIGKQDTIIQMKKIFVRCADTESIRLYRESGADGVILPLSGYAFSPCDCFRKEDLDACIQTIRDMGMEVYLQADKLFSQNEMPVAEALLREPGVLSADGIFFSDPGLFAAAEEQGIAGRMIYDPQTLMTNGKDMQWWLSCGLKAVVVSPLLSAEEITHLGIPAAQYMILGHGYQIMSVSRRPLLSLYTEGKDTEILKNRNDIRIREESREGFMPVYEDENYTIVYMDAVLTSVPEVCALEQDGDVQVIINAAFLPADCVSDAVRTYRTAESENARECEQALIEAYPGIAFTKGYYENKTVK